MVANELHGIRGVSSVDRPTGRSGVRFTAVGGRGGDGEERGMAVRRGVLVLEGEGSCLTAWLAALAELGASITSAHDASAARGSTSYAVIVLGAMPLGQCPIALARELRGRPPDDRPRILLVSREEIRRVDRVHVDAVLARPARNEVLVAHVRRLLALAERTTPGVRRERSGRLG